VQSCNVFASGEGRSLRVGTSPFQKRNSVSKLQYSTQISLTHAQRLAAGEASSRNRRESVLVENLGKRRSPLKGLGSFRRRSQSRRGGIISRVNDISATIATEVEEQSATTSEMSRKRCRGRQRFRRSRQEHHRSGIGRAEYVVGRDGIARSGTASSGDVYRTAGVGRTVQG
jgi:hypothetical protein